MPRYGPSHRRIAVISTLLAVAFVLTFARETFARPARPCPPTGFDDPIFGLASTWTGEIGGRPMTCKLCSFVVDYPFFSDAFVGGTCRVAHFHHRKLFSADGGTPGEGSFCPRRTRRQKARCVRQPDGPGGERVFFCGRPLPPSCCALTLPSVAFDTTHAPVALSGTFACREGSGQFTLSSAGVPQSAANDPR